MEATEAMQGVDRVLRKIKNGRKDINGAGLVMVVKEEFGRLPEGDLPEGPYGEVIALARITQFELTSSGSGAWYNRTGMIAALEDVQNRYLR
jgi:hypothetical protein